MATWTRAVCRLALVPGFVLPTPCMLGHDRGIGYYHIRQQNTRCSGASATTSSVPLGSEMVFLHLVKKSDNTRVVVLLFLVAVKGPTKFTDNTCQSLPAKRRCLWAVLAVVPCLPTGTLRTHGLVVSNHLATW